MLTDTLRRALSAASGAQGALGAVCLAVGTLMVAGPGYALLALGALFLLGAWSSR